MDGTMSDEVAIKAAAEEGHPEWAFWVCVWHGHEVKSGPYTHGSYSNRADAEAAADKWAAEHPPSGGWNTKVRVLNLCQYRVA